MPINSDYVLSKTFDGQFKQHNSHLLPQIGRKGENVHYAESSAFMFDTLVCSRWRPNMTIPFANIF